jgi:hypothetical protein
LTRRAGGENDRTPTTFLAFAVKAPPIEAADQFAERFDQFSLRFGITSDGNAKLFRMETADFSVYLVVRYCIVRGMRVSHAQAAELG